MIADVIRDTALLLLNSSRFAAVLRRRGNPDAPLSLPLRFFVTGAKKGPCRDASRILATFRVVVVAIFLSLSLALSVFCLSLSVVWYMLSHASALVTLPYNFHCFPGLCQDSRKEININGKPFGISGDACSGTHTC